MAPSKGKCESGGDSKPLTVPSAKELRRALEKIESGDKKALSKLREVYDEHPAVWRTLGDLALQVQEGILSGFYDKATGEAVRRKLAEMREKLGAEGASELEGLLVERVVACWLRVQHAESMKTRNLKRDTPMQTLLSLDRLLGNAHRNFVSACKTLAQVRRLLRPRVSQVNIGGQQVNVGQMDARKD